MKTKGMCENDRNAQNADLYKAIIRKIFGVTDVIVGHHIVFVIVEKRLDPETKLEFDYQCVQELASADTLLFDHEIAKKMWGEGFKETLARLAVEPAETRDLLLKELWEERGKDPEFNRC